MQPIQVKPVPPLSGYELGSLQQVGGTQIQSCLHGVRQILPGVAKLEVCFPAGGLLPLVEK